MGLFDVHAHLTSHTLLPRIGALIDAATAVGVTSMVSNGLNPADNLAVLDLAARYPSVKPALGLYPVDAVLPEMLAAGLQYPREDADKPVCGADAVQWVREHIDRAFAVGEIGLDGHWVPEAFWALQEQHFRALVQIAIDAERAIIIHTRKREKRALEILTEMRAPRVDWHCFGSKTSLARAIVDVPGHFLSIPSNVRRHAAFGNILASFPREKILLETDCPYLPAVPGGESEPAHVAGTAAFASELWKLPPEEVQLQLERNFYTLFGVQA